VLLRAGKYPLLAGLGFPKRLAYDFAGELVALGSRVRDLKVGDQVYGMLQWRAGAAAEYCLASPGELWLKPASLSYEQAAALPLTALTALQALRDDAKLKTGQRVLVHGASGGVGVCAVQLAKALGAHVTSVSSAGNRELLMELGSDAWYDYETGLAGAEGGPYDVFFDVFGNRSLSQTRSMLTPAGCYVSTVPKPHVFRDRVLTSLAPLTSTRRAQLVVALKDAALSALARDGEEIGLQLSALAKVAAEAGLITNPPREIPFLRGYFEKAVSLLAMQNQGRIRIPVPAKAVDAAAP